MGESDHAIITQSLLSVFLFVLVMAAAWVTAIVRWRRFKAGAALMLPDAAFSERDERTALPEVPSFVLQRTHSWLAVKGSNVQAVQGALSLHNAKPSAWSEGLLGEGRQRVFVAPPIQGWILIIGPALPDPAQDVDACFKVFCDLSRKLGHVQFFQVEPVQNQYAWGRAENGRVRRAYSWAGRTLWNQGPLTTAEIELELRCLEYGEVAESTVFQRQENGLGEAEKVHLLAGRWSLDVAEVDRRLLERRCGIVGEAFWLR